MPNTESAKRGHRKSERRRIINKSQRSTLKTTIKKVRVSAGASDAESAKTALGTAIKKLDQGAGKHLIHKNKAARLKSRLTKLVNKLSAPKTA
ncbi:MAG TPA: 30S ribosomal protein S20 [Planctomycetaceae bacterium]|nr:30S ribosomal protein S20 [Planctomycetaceae bacterium]